MNEKAIKEIVSRVTQVANLQDDSELIDSGLLDSFAITNLISELESTFQVRIPGDRVSEANFGRIDRIAAMLADLKK
jgi:acyl carrier protein